LIIIIIISLLFSKLVNWSCSKFIMSGKVFCVCRLEFWKSRVGSWKDFSIFPEQLFLKFFFVLGKKVSKFKANGMNVRMDSMGGVSRLSCAFFSLHPFRNSFTGVWRNHQPLVSEQPYQEPKSFDLGW
jgi:hypothetical protein